MAAVPGTNCRAPALRRFRGRGLPASPAATATAASSLSLNVSARGRRVGVAWDPRSEGGVRKVGCLAASRRARQLLGSRAGRMADRARAQLAYGSMFGCHAARCGGGEGGVNARSLTQDVSASAALCLG